MSQSMDADSSSADAQAPDRRRFLSVSSTFAMTGGLVAGYGTFATMAGNFLYPAGDNPVGWLFVAAIEQFKPGQAVAFTAPSGATIVVARQGEGETVEDFIALSSVCPHLGCQVHWDSVNDYFFCPCHNGAFNAQGEAIKGPPKDAKQSLKEYPLKVEGGLLFIEAPLQSLQGEQALAASTTDSSSEDPHSEIPSQAKEA